jgi:hypothetical protein
MNRCYRGWRPVPKQYPTLLRRCEIPGPYVAPEDVLGTEPRTLELRTRHSSLDEGCLQQRISGKAGKPAISLCKQRYS